MNSLLHFLGRVSRQWHGIEGKEMRIFISGKGRETAGRGRDLLVAHHGTVQARCAPAGKHIADGVVDCVIGVAVAWPVISLEVNRLRRVFHQDRAFRILRGLRADELRGLAAGGNAAKVFRNSRHGGYGVEVTHDGHHQVAGYVVRLEEVHRIRRREILQVARVPNGWAMVRVRVEGNRQELLDHALGRVGIGSHAALFHHHIALLVKLAHHRMGEAFGFEIGPQFKTVDRHGVKINRLIVGGERVQPDPTLALHNLVESALDDILVSPGDGIFPRLFEFRDLLGIAAGGLDPFGAISGIGRFDLGQSRLLGCIIGGADLVGAFERHVLHHVRQAGHVKRILR